MDTFAKPFLADVGSLILPVLTGSLDLIAERDAYLADQIHHHAQAIERALASDLPAHATARAALLGSLLRRAFFRGLLDFDGACDARDLVAALLDGLRPLVKEARHA